MTAPTALPQDTTQRALTRLRKQAMSNSAAQTVLYGQDGGLGPLESDEDRMLEQVRAWKALSSNDHADTVLMLLDLIDQLRSGSEVSA